MKVLALTLACFFDFSNGQPVQTIAQNSPLAYSQEPFHIGMPTPMKVLAKLLLATKPEAAFNIPATKASAIRLHRVAVKPLMQATESSVEESLLDDYKDEGQQPSNGPKPLKIWVGNTPFWHEREVVRSELEKLFEPYGNMAASVPFRGSIYGFVTFKDAVAGDKALKELNGTKTEFFNVSLVLQRSTMGVRNAETDTLAGKIVEKKIPLKKVNATMSHPVFVSGIPVESIVGEKIREMLEPYGKVSAFNLFKDKKQAFYDTGLAVMESADDAKKAIKELNGTLFCGQALIMAEGKANEKTVVPEGGLSVFLSNINCDVPVIEKLTDVFKPIGDIEQVLYKRPKKRDATVRRLYKRTGYVGFASASSVKTAVEKMDGFEMFENKLRVEKAKSVSD